jgi:hypothetical protein
MGFWGVLFMILVVLWGLSNLPLGVEEGPNRYRGVTYGRSWLPYICFLMLSLFVFGVISPGFTGLNQPNPPHSVP